MSYEDVIKTMLPQQGRQSPHVTGHFGEQRANGRHGGSDFNYEGGQAGINLIHPVIHSPVAGVVSFVGGQYGTIKIRDADGNSHEILHTHSQSVAVGQTIAAGDEIGTMGGRGPQGAMQYAQHVHYQMKDGQGNALSPEAFWNERPLNIIGAADTETPLRQPVDLVQRGSRGANVLAIQSRLTELGYTDAQHRPLKIDGVFGPATQQALETFQREHGLVADGIAGPRTRNGLETETAHFPAPQATENTCSLDDGSHAAHELFRQGLSGIHQLNIEHNIGPSIRDHCIAGALTVEATAKGLHRIDRVILSEDANRLFAVQGGTWDFDRKLASVDTMTAINTPLDISSAQWPQAAQQARLAQEAQQEQRAAQQQALPHSLPPMAATHSL
jgi:putative chitinase